MKIIYKKAMRLWCKKFDMPILDAILTGFFISLISLLWLSVILGFFYPIGSKYNDLAYEIGKYPFLIILGMGCICLAAKISK